LQTYRHEVSDVFEKSRNNRPDYKLIGTAYLTWRLAGLRLIVYFNLLPRGTLTDPDFLLGFFVPASVMGIARTIRAGLHKPLFDA
jgi:hypothetical protein